MLQPLGLWTWDPIGPLSMGLQNFTPEVSRDSKVSYGACWRHGLGQGVRHMLDDWEGSVVWMIGPTDCGMLELPSAPAKIHVQAIYHPCSRMVAFHIQLNNRPPTAEGIQWVLARVVACVLPRIGAKFWMTGLKTKQRYCMFLVKLAWESGCCSFLTQETPRRLHRSSTFDEGLGKRIQLRSKALRLTSHKSPPIVSFTVAKGIGGSAMVFAWAGVLEHRPREVKKTVSSGKNEQISQEHDNIPGKHWQIPSLVFRASKLTGGARPVTSRLVAGEDHRGSGAWTLHQTRPLGSTLAPWTARTAPGIDPGHFHRLDVRSKLDVTIWTCFLDRFVMS